MKPLYETIFDKEASLKNVVVKPRSNSELKRIIDEHIKRIKPKLGDEVDLNWIDISQIDDLDAVFSLTNYIPVIDKWDITHVKNFSYMFACNEHITRSPLPVLQKKLLAPSCYAEMFFGCTALKEPPVLPAMELTRWCYGRMFQDCTSLVEPPELPATELKPYCYWCMFEGCSSLKAKAKAPTEIDLSKMFAHDMYKGCPCKYK